MLNIITTPIKCLIVSIVINLTLVTPLVAQQTCATKGNFPLPEISESAKNKLQQDLDAATANLNRNPTGLNELIWAGRRTD